MMIANYYRGRYVCNLCHSSQEIGEIRSSRGTTEPFFGPEIRRGDGWILWSDEDCCLMGNRSGCCVNRRQVMSRVRRSWR